MKISNIRLCGFVICLINLAGISAYSDELPSSTTTTSLSRFNVRVNPIGLIFGIIGANVDIGVTDQLAIGPAFAMIQTGSNAIGINAYQIGLDGSYFLNSARFLSGPVVRASLHYILLSFSNLNIGSSEIGKSHNWVASTLLGYQWQKNPTGLNFTLGAGIAYYGAPPKTSFNVDSRSKISFISAQGFQPQLEATVGWAI